jgi:hypothetical protein
MLTIAKQTFAITAVMLTTGLACAHPSHQHSDAECYLHGHRLYLVDGLNYPRNAWASWGISCRVRKSDGIEVTETTAGDRDRQSGVAGGCANISAVILVRNSTWLATG